MGKAIQSVEGAKLISRPTKGTGQHFQCVTAVELSGKATLAAVTAAVEAAKTPHLNQCAPGVATVVSGRLKAGTTPADITDALKKAGLLEE